MLQSVKIEGLFGNKEAIDVFINNKLYILTGDNGSGKTTIINSIYYALNGNFEWFLNQNIKSINIVLLPNKHDLMYIFVGKDNGETNTLNIHYHFNNRDIYLKVTKNSVSKKIKYEEVNEGSNIKKKNVKKKNDNNIFSDLNISYDFIFGYENTTINDLMKKDLQKYDFLKKLRQSFIYFPTYRRIDIDLKNYIESFMPDSEMDVKEPINLINENLEDDRRVIGVGNQGIEGLYNEFSKALNKFNSEGMEKLLNNHVKNVIQSVSTNEENERGNRQKASPSVTVSLDYDDSAPDSLIELADLLNIDVQENEINAYYNRKRNVIDRLRNTKDTNIKNDISLLKTLVGFSTYENKFVDELSKMYLNLKKSQNDFMIPYTFLKDSIDIFFKGKISIEINSDNEIFLAMNEKPLQFSQLSTGEKQIITILSYTALAISSSDYHPLIIIDEPELSLHIRWQNILLKQLSQKENLSIMVATHSPYIANREFSKNTFQLGEVDE